MQELQHEAVNILIVEDNPHDAELMIRALKKNKLANELFVAEDGEEALDFVFNRGKFSEKQTHQLPKVIFLDLKLPKLNGLEVLKEIKSTPLTRSIPVIIVTSSREDPDIKAAYDLGANSYVVKPVNFEEFFQAMDKLGFYWLLINECSK
ncbi:MAG: response regulator [candidate division KSB1 bacterium]|nr:response regulator [candidate division KSB1 bacterium]